MIKSIVFTNKSEKALKIIVEPMADEVFIKPGGHAEFFVEVKSPSSDFKIEENEDELTLYLPGDFGEVKVSIDGCEPVDL